MCMGVVQNCMEVMRNCIGVVQHCTEVMQRVSQMLPKGTECERRLRKCAAYVQSGLHCIQQGQACQWCNNYKTLNLYLQVSISIPAVRTFWGYQCGTLILAGNLISEKYMEPPNICLFFVTQALSSAVTDKLIIDYQLICKL